MSQSLSISVVIPVRNEAANLDGCLAALGRDYAEVIVVDSGSTDATCEIAARHGCRVVPFTWNGRFPKKRNWVLRNVPLANEWVLFLDADESVTPEFAAELRRTMPGTDRVGFWLTYRNAFMGSWLRFGDRFRKLALFRKDAGEYECIDDNGWSTLDMEVHEHPVLRGPVGCLHSPILHRDFKGMEAYRERHASYARWEANRYLALQQGGQARLTGRQRLKYGLVDTPLLGPLYFVGSYVFKLGFLDGRAGFWFAWHKMRYFLRIHDEIHRLRGGPGSGPPDGGQRVLILNQFYPPDLAPTGQVAHDLARYLVRRGHTVEVVTSRRGYAGDAYYPAREVRDGVLVRRLPALAFGPKGHVRKSLSYASFYLAVLLGLAVLRPRPQIVVALTTPPYVGLLARLVGFCRRWRRIHWVMDLYPDVLEAHGMLGAGRLGRAALVGLRWLTRRELAGADAVLALGPDMAQRAARYTRPPARLEWVPLWAPACLRSDADLDRDRLRHRRGWDDRLVLLYSGNMGLGHRFQEFLQAAERLERAAGSEPRPGQGRVRFAFAGRGRRRPEIEAFVAAHPEAGVELLDYVDQADLPAHLASADVLLASLEPGWEGCMLPSKIQGMFAAGRPVIFIGPADSSPACWVAEANAGWVVAPGDVDGLLECVAAASDPAERAHRGTAARTYALSHFDPERNCARVAELVEASRRGPVASPR